MEIRISVTHKRPEDYRLPGECFAHADAGETGNVIDSLLALYRESPGADYYGAMSAERYLSFAENAEGEASEAYMTDNVAARHCLTQAGIERALIGVSAVAAAAGDTGTLKYYRREWKHDFRDYYWHYMKLKTASLELHQIRRAVLETHPEYLDEFDRAIAGTRYYETLCFVLPGAWMERFCRLAEDVLARLRPFGGKTRLSRNNAQWRDEVAKLLLLAFLNAQTAGGARLRETGTVRVEHTERYRKPEPAFAENNVALVTVSSGYFVPYLAVWLQSHLDHFAPENNYDVLVLASEITELDKERLLRMTEGMENVSLRFVDPRPLLENTVFYRSYQQFCQEAYYRLFAPWLLENYDRAVVMDGDIVANYDVAELYREELDEKAIGSFLDTFTMGFASKYTWHYDYMKYELGLDDPFGYYNTGVMVIDLARMRARHTLEEVVEYGKKHAFIFQEQDIINTLLKDEIKRLDLSWNYAATAYIPKAEILRNHPLEYLAPFETAAAAPKMIHYMGLPKPWTNPEIRYAEDFWSVARRTPFYERILFETIRSAKENEEDDGKGERFIPRPLAEGRPAPAGAGVEALRNRHRNERCFFVGTGPSLRREDLQLLKGEITFFAGDLERLSAWTDWRPRYYLRGAALEEGARKVALPLLDAEAAYEGMSADDKPENVYYSADCGKVVYQAFIPMFSLMQLAQYMGFSEIYLVGCDGKYNLKRPHCWDAPQEAAVPARQAEEDTERLKKGFLLMGAAAREFNMRVYNATHGGAISDFLRVEFDSLDFARTDE